MGGGGGGGYFHSDPDEVVKMLRKAEASTEDVKFEVDTASMLSSLLTNFNDRDHDAINTHLEEIRKALGRDIDGTVDLHYAGSVAKHTYVDGLSDVDSLVMLDNCELAGRPPEEAKDYFVQRLKERFPTTEVWSGNLAVTLKFSDAEVQLLPAVACGDSIKISDGTGKSWAQISPKNFSAALTEVNQSKGNKVVPVIKLAKAIIAGLPEQHQISGYHAEALAVKIFRSYDGEIALKPMVKHFFREASQAVNGPIKDSTGQSIHVDEYLGPSNSLERKIVSDAFGRINRKMANADSSASISEWGKLFGLED